MHVKWSCPISDSIRIARKVFSVPSISHYGLHSLLACYVMKLIVKVSLKKYTNTFQALPAFLVSPFRDFSFFCDFASSSSSELFFCARYRDRKCFLGGRMDMAKTQVINLSGAQQPTYIYSGLVNGFWNHRTRKWDLELIIFIISSISEHANLETESFLWLIASH